ncbi:cell division protein ZapA [Parabacteroides sp. Marseille-P3160]|uniref:cell division protein ZapA n=1 Tax=Parabacteroides sp. Marseille-P3160 TaxID=1917887 RepID=UPI0009BB2EA3|nr:cell division protein ZapA [Parabacteroides sp. Marseille-P3160]
MDDQILIHVQIAERKYPVWVRRSDEELARKAAKQIQNKINQYQQYFAKEKVSAWDALAMVTFQLSIENLQLEEKNDTIPIMDKIKDLAGELTNYLKDNK